MGDFHMRRLVQRLSDDFARDVGFDLSNETDVRPASGEPAEE